MHDIINHSSKRWFSPGISFALFLGFGTGAVIGMALESIGLGMALGTVIGLSLATAISQISAGEDQESIDPHIYVHSPRYWSQPKMLALFVLLFLSLTLLWLA